MKRTIISIVLFLLVGISLFSQYSGNIEDRRMHTDSVRFVMSERLNFRYFNNNGKSYFQLSNNLGTQFKFNDLKSILLFLGDYTIVRAEGQDFQNSWFLHLRYNRKWSQLFRTEIFIQNQRDKVLDVTHRNLLGAGIRFKLISKDNLNLYWGNTYIYELEKSDFVDGSFNNHRYSTYVSTSFDIPIFNVVTKSGKVEEYKISIVNTLYYQPLFNNFSDYRVLEQFNMSIPITSRFSLDVYFNYFKDSITPLDRDQFRSEVVLGGTFKIK